MSDRWIVIPRWDGPEGFQHYKDRDPRWIKVYTWLLNDEDYLRLTWVQRGVLHGLWMEYARSNRQIPDSTMSVSRRLGERVTRATLDALNHAGFIEFAASKPLATCYQAASPEREGEREKNPLPREAGTNPRAKGTNSRATGDSPRQQGTSPRQLAKYTGCKRTRGTHSFGWKHTPLGMDQPPKDWPHPPPSQTEIEQALAAAAEFIAGVNQ